ncbi:MAG TPA: hypothetical protein VJT69_04470 [Pyrinomonadaceae bacterium]|nr:hypothetical protein [Pyrinomonadaceae bacterium]
MFKLLRRDLSLTLAAAAVFLALSYAIGSKPEVSPEITASEIVFLDGDNAPRKQAATGRIWKEYTFEETLALDPPIVKRPTSLRVGNGGEIYLLDWDELQVKMFSPEGTLLKTFGQGRATGVGAFVNPTALSVRLDGELWVCDPKQGSIKRFSPDGRTQEFRPQGAAIRIASVGDLVVTMAPPTDETLFEVYDLVGNRLGTFGRLIKDQSSKSITLDGDLAADDEGRGFIYASYTVPVIAGYGVDGRRRFIVQPIEAGPPPMALKIGENQQTANKMAITVMRSLSIDGDKLYVVYGTIVPSVGNKGGMVMDVYDKRDGTYLFSFKLPLACREAVVRGNYIYALLSGGRLRVWRFEHNA